MALSIKICGRRTPEALGLVQESVDIAGRLAGPDTAERTPALPGLAASLQNAAAALSDRAQPLSVKLK